MKNSKVSRPPIQPISIPKKKPARSIIQPVGNPKPLKTIQPIKRVQASTAKKY